MNFKGGVAGRLPAPIRVWLARADFLYTLYGVGFHTLLGRVCNGHNIE
jgi:hypothetical protein